MHKPHPSEFAPLPFYPFDERSPTFELSLEEAETAIFMDGGDLNKAAARLKVTRIRLNKAIRRYAKLRLLIAALAKPSD